MAIKKRRPRSAAPAARRKRAVESFKSAADAIGPIEKDMSLFALTRGQWSMIDAILHILDEVGRAKISLWTWAVAHYEVEVLTRLMRDDRLTGGLFVVDHGARGRNGEIIRNWQKVFGPDSVRYVVNHAKIATVESEGGLKLLARGSMNLNFNPRFEQFDLTEGGEDFDLVREIEEDLPILPDDCTGPEAYDATRAGEVFDDKTLDLFGGVKVWSK